MIEERKFEVKTYSKSKLAAKYRVDLSTFKKWCVGIGKIFTEEQWGKRHFLKPIEVQLIIDKLGEP